METKLFNLGEVKIISSDDASKSFSGYGAVFGNVDAVGDVIVKGAFADTIERDALPLMFLNHEMFSLPIGKWTKMEEDDYGLKVEGEFIDTTLGRDVYQASKAGAISGLSIGYRVEGYNTEDSGIRSLTKLALAEISVVTFPCNSKARITDIKSLTDHDQFQRQLMALGLPADEAKSFLTTYQNIIETKYKQAAELKVARNILSKLQGEK